LNRVVLSLAASVFALTAFAAPALADDYHWNHNGSYVDIDPLGPGQITVRYYSPKQSIRAAGVRPGTLLFSGKEGRNYNVSGTAYVFRAGCAPTPYRVSGSFDKTGYYKELDLYGPAPILGKGSCTVIGYDPNGTNAYLHFDYLGPWD
jgi:hypothetical protein